VPGMPPRDLRPAVIPDSGISPFEAAILVTSWTTVTHPGALGVWPQHGPDGGWLYGRASNSLRDLRSELGNDLPPLYREHQTDVVPVEEFFIRSVFVRHRLRLAAEAFFETRAAIFRMPQGILGDAEPALRRLRRNLALLVLGRTHRPLRQPALFPAQRLGGYILGLAQQGRVSLHTSLDPDLHLRMPPQTRRPDEDDSDSSDLEDDGESILAGTPPF
jgi:hypothetical protein